MLGLIWWVGVQVALKFVYLGAGAGLASVLRKFCTFVLVCFRWLR